MIIAWHFLTDESFIDAEDNFQKILNQGFLSAAAFRTNPNLEELDILAGDDRYLFLSLYPYVTDCYFPERKWCQLPSKIYGFGFDIEVLISKGAIVRTIDLLTEYHFLFEELDSLEKDRFQSVLMFQKKVEDLKAKFQLTGHEAFKFVKNITQLCFKLQSVDNIDHLGEYEYEELQDACAAFKAIEILVFRELSLDNALYIVDNGEFVLT